MRPTENIKKLIKNAPIKTNPAVNEAVLKDLLNELDKSKKNPSAALQPKIWRKIMKSKITKLTTATVVIIAIFVGIYAASGPILVSIAFADMRNALADMPLMHKNLYTTHSDSKEHHTENWYYFDSRIVIAKCSVGGKCYKISSLDYNSMKNVVFDPGSESVNVLHRTDVNSKNLPESPWAAMKKILIEYKKHGTLSDPERSQYEGNDVDIYQLTMPKNYSGERVEAELVVNRHSHLPMVYKRKFWTPRGQLVFDQVIYYDFPETGPKDIYDLSVPHSTKVTVDSESEKRLDKMRHLKSLLPVLKQQLNESYYLEEKQVLRHIPPSLIGPRIKLDQANREISQLEYLSSQNKITDRYLLFYWDGKIIEGSRPVFSKGVTLNTAFERIIGLSRFQYDIPEDLVNIEIPGDWILRKQTTKEDILRALNKIVQDYTKRSIRFEKRQIERDVIVVRGKFHFEPLSGTYDDSCLHVFSDKLDPDESGGGGTRSLDGFLNQRLAVTQLNQQVVNLAETPDEELIRYRTHYSGYLGKLPDGPERSAKLDMLLENLTRQTSLTFTKERRIVDVWYVVEGK